MRQNRCQGRVNSGASTDLDVKHSHHADWWQVTPTLCGTYSATEPFVTGMLFQLRAAQVPSQYSSFSWEKTSSPPFLLCCPLLWLHLFPDTHACNQRDFLARASLQLPAEGGQTYQCHWRCGRQWKAQLLAADIVPKQAKIQFEDN